MIATHELSVEKAIASLNQDGMPAPSIAIQPKDRPGAGFGNVSFIFSEPTISPSAHEMNRVYSEDAWTGMHPKPVSNFTAPGIAEQIETRLGVKLTEEQLQKMTDYMGRGNTPGYFLMNNQEMRSSSNSNSDRKIDVIFNRYKHEKGLQNIDSMPNVEKWIDDVLAEIAPPTHFRPTVRNYHPSSESNYRELPLQELTVENVLKHIIEQDKLKPMTEEQVRAEVEAAIISEIENSSVESSASEIADIVNIVAKEAYDKRYVSESKKDTEIFESMERIRAEYSRLESGESRYFESKPYRIVGNNEIRGAVIPADAPTQLKTLLEERGIQYVEYQNSEERQPVTNAFSTELQATHGDVYFQPPINADVNLDATVRIVDFNTEQQAAGQLATPQELLEHIKSFIGKEAMLSADSKTALEVSSNSKAKHLVRSSWKGQTYEELDAKSTALLSLDDVVKNSVLIESQPNFKPEKKDLINVHRLYVPMRIENELHVLRIVAHENKSKNGLTPISADLFDLIVEREKSALSQSGSTLSSAPPVPMGGTSEITIREMLSGVNDAFGEPYTQDSSRPSEPLQPQQQPRSQPRAQIAFDRTGKATITLFQNADASSLFHELAHKMLYDFMRWGDTGTANEQYRADAKAALEFIGTTKEEFEALYHRQEQAEYLGDMATADRSAKCGVYICMGGLWPPVLTISKANGYKSNFIGYFITAVESFKSVTDFAAIPNSEKFTIVTCKLLLNFITRFHPNANNNCVGADFEFQIVLFTKQSAVNNFLYFYVAGNSDVFGE